MWHTSTCPSVWYPRVTETEVLECCASDSLQSAMSEVDLSGYSSSGSDSGSISDVSDHLELDLDYSSDDSASFSPVRLGDVAHSDAPEHALQVDVYQHKHAHIAEQAAQEQYRMVSHFTDLNVPHVFAGILNAHLLVDEQGGVVKLHSHISQQELLRVLWAVTEPERMTNRERGRVLKLLQSTKRLSTPLILCIGSNSAERYWRREMDDDDPLHRQILGPHSVELRRVPQWAHLCHLGEALYLRWLLDGKLPRLIWHVVLLMYTAERMTARAAFFAFSGLFDGQQTPDGESFANSTRIVGAGYWDDFKAKYYEIKQSLQDKYPAWRAEVGQRLERYATQATDAVKQAYGQTKVWARDLNTRYENELKPWLKKQYNETIKPAAGRAWESTRDAARNLVKYASQARAYVGQHLSELMQRIKTDPRFGQLKQKLRALAQEAHDSGVRFWEYMKVQLERGNVKAQELIQQVKVQIDKLKIKLSQPQLESGIEQGVASILNQPDDDVGGNSVSTPSANSRTNRYGAPETDSGELDVDFINNYRPYARTLGEPKTTPTAPTISNTTTSTVAAQEPQSVSSANPIASESETPYFYRPMPPRDQERINTEAPDEALFVEPLGEIRPPPVPPRDDVVESEVVPATPLRDDDMMSHMPTFWQSSEAAAQMDAKRLSEDLSQALNQVQWWLSGSNVSYYNPTVVSSTLSLIEQIRSGVPKQQGGGVAHVNKNHSNPIYQLMQRGHVQNDAMQLKRNREIQRLVGVANEIMLHALYHPNNNSVGDSMNPNAYGAAINDMLNRGLLTESTLEDLMAFIEALEDQQAHVDAMRGPFDRSSTAARTAGGVSAHVMRASGRAFVCDHLNHRTVGATRDDSCMNAELDHDHVLEDLHHHQSSLHQALHEIDSGLVRCAVFEKSRFNCAALQNGEVLETIDRLLHQTDAREHASVGKALYNMRCTALFHAKAVPGHDGVRRKTKDYEPLDLVMRTTQTLNWLYALGGLLEATHLVDLSVSSKQFKHVPLATTWELVVLPILRNACKRHHHSGQYKRDPIGLNCFDEELHQTLSDLKRIGVISSQHGGVAHGEDNSAARRTYRSTKHAVVEVARMLHACQPLPYSCLRDGNHWHDLWEQITAVQVQRLGLPPGWKLSSTRPVNPNSQSKSTTAMIEVNIGTIMDRLERATELERRCAHSHERRLVEASFDISLSTDHHLKHLQTLMRAQRCWAIQVLRAHPEHSRQYLLLRMEATLGYLNEQVINDWVESDDVRRSISSVKLVAPAIQSSSEVAVITPSLSAVTINAPSRSKPWTKDSLSYAQKSQKPTLMIEEATTSTGVVQSIDSIYASSERGVVAIVHQPVAFCASFIDPSNPTPISACAVMLESHAARSWDELLHIFTSFGIIEYV